MLDYWGLPQWFGLQASQVYTSDTGYAYVVNNLGLPLTLFLLGIFAFHRPKTPEAISMKAIIAVYMATSLCIGANMFTIKTAAICWFLYGAANVTPRALARDTRQKVYVKIALIRNHVTGFQPRTRTDFALHGIG